MRILICSLIAIATSVLASGCSTTADVYEGETSYSHSGTTEVWLPSETGDIVIGRSSDDPQ